MIAGNHVVTAHVICPCRVFATSSRHLAFCSTEILRVRDVSLQSLGKLILIDVEIVLDDLRVA
jgi:3-polyprenyl-4-hydroxybenzoate decarboxylase